MISIDFSQPSNPRWCDVIGNDPMLKFVHHNKTGFMTNDENLHAFLQYIAECPTESFDLPMVQQRILHQSTAETKIGDLPFMEFILAAAAGRQAFDGRLFTWLINREGINLWFYSDPNGLLHSLVQGEECKFNVKNEMMERLMGPGQINAPRDAYGYPALGVAIVASDLEMTLELLRRGASVSFKFENDDYVKEEGLLLMAEDYFGEKDVNEIRMTWMATGCK